VHITWGPQALVWVFIGLSVAGGLICLVLMIARPRRRREPAPLPADGRPPEPRLRVPPALAHRVGATAEEAGEGGPWPPPGGRGGRARWLATAGVSVFILLNLPVAWLTPAVAVVASVPVALAVALTLVIAAALTAAFAVAVRSPRAGGLLALAGAGALTLAAVHILLFQVLRKYPPDFGWPINFPFSHILGLIAVFLLGAEAVRELVRRLPPGH
jgi:hypothetical protein